MPALKPETEKQRAQALLKPLIKHNLNQTAVARELGVNQKTINEKYHRPIVQKTLAEYLKKSFKRNYIRKKFQDGLEATKVVGYLHQFKKNKDGKVEKAEPDEVVSNEFIDVPDYSCRHKYLVTLLECQGHIKTNGNGKGHNATTVIIRIGNQSGLLSPAEASIISHQRS